MAGTVETSIVLNAVDNTKSALNSVQSNLEKLVHEAVKVSSSFSKIDTSWLEWFSKAIAENQNKVWELRSKLADCEKGTYEYIRTTNQLNKALREWEVMWKEHDEAIRKENEALNQDYIASKNQEQAEQQLTEAVNKNNTSLLDNIKNLFSHKNATEWNIQAQKYWEEQIKRVENELSQASTDLSKLEQSTTASSKEIQNQKEYIRQLELQLKEYKKQLKDTTANMSPFQLAIQKLWKNIKSLFLLQAAKNFLSWVKKLLKSAFDELIEWWLKLEAVVDYFDELAERGWMDAKELRNSLREASRWMITDVELMTSANKAMMLWVGWSVQEMSDLMKIAVVRGQEMWESATKAFDDMVIWIWRLSPKILDNLWIIINLKDTYAKYAQQVWKSTSELTKAEQQYAVMQEVIKKSRTELELWWNGHLTVADKMQVMKVKWQNALDTIGWAFFRWLEPVIDWINEILDEWTEMADDLSAKMDSSTHNIWVSISALLSTVVDNLKSTVWNLWDVISQLGSDIFGALKDIWDWCLDLFFGIKSDWSSSAMTFWQVFMAVLQKIWQGIEAASIMIKQLWTVIRTGTGNAKNWLWAIWKWFKDAMQPWVKLKDAYGEFMRWFWTYQADEIVEVKDLLKDLWDEWVDFGAKVITQENKLAEAFVKWENYIHSWVGNWKSIFGWDDETTWWGWGSKNNKKQTEEEKQRIKEVKDTYQWLEDQIKSAYKNYEEAVKKYDELWESSEKYIEKSKDEIKDLEEDLVKLKDKLRELNEELNELYSDRWTDIWNSLLKSQDVLDKYFYKLWESSFDRMKEAVEWLTQRELQIMDWKGESEYMWYAISDLMELKKAMENVASFWNLTDKTWLKDMSDMIDEARKKAEQTDIENIEETFQSKRAEIQKQIDDVQWQIDEKETKITELQTKITLIQDLQVALSQKWLWEIETQREKYKNAAEEKLKYEREHQTELDLTYVALNKNTQEIQEQERLMRKMLEEWREMHGWGWWTWHRAGWWVVYWWNSYIVWEHWPELFTPNVSGKITPNNQITNNNWIEINISWVSVRSDWDIQAIADEITRRIKLEKNFWIA